MNVQQLYKETLLRHSKNAANQRALPDATCSHKQRNPLCGDEITVSLKIHDGAIADLVYEARCCSICAASASMLADTARGRPTSELSDLASNLIEHLKRTDNFNTPAQDALPGDLAALEAVRQFPSRVRCATLPFEAALEALRTGANSEF